MVTARQPVKKMSDAAVQKATGKTWKEWSAILDKAGAAQWPHKQIAAHLYEQLGVPGWWSQMVANTYEQERGLRQKHQKPDGYQVSVSKVIAVPTDMLYRAWADARLRATWLADAAITVRKATQDKSMRITWVDGKTSVEVNFYGKGQGKSQVTVQHSKLPTPESGERMKAYWKEQLERLQGVLKGG